MTPLVTGVTGRDMAQFREQQDARRDGRIGRLKNWCVEGPNARDTRKKCGEMI